jgi:hypothetical protein
MLTSLLVGLLLLQSSQQMRPFLGVSANVIEGPIEAGEQTWPHGLEIYFVTPDSGAAAAGVVAGDIIVAVEGVDWSPPADELPQRFVDAVGQKERGERIALTLVRGDVVVRVKPELGVRPTQNPVTRKIPPNAEILPDGVPEMPTARLAARVIEQFDFAADYAALRARLARLAEEGDPFRLHRVAYVLREPFAIEPLSQAAADLPAGLAGMLEHAAAQLDRPLAPATPASLKTGISKEEHVAQIYAVLERADGHYQRAFAKLSLGQRAFLRRTFGEVCTAFRELVMVLVDEDQARKANVIHFVELAQQVDVAALIAAARELGMLLDEDYLAGLQRDLAGGGDGILIKEKTPLGLVVVAGGGDQWHREEATVLIDFGGDEHYTFRTPKALSVIVDLGGDDVYQATEDESIGAGVFGVALQLDAGGDDRYVGQQWTQGAAALGVGVLWDRAGDDVYRAADYSQAAAFVGVGLLIDEAGDDQYEAPRYAQSLGMPGGFAALVDRGGNDRYFVGGRDRTNYGTEGVFDAMGQACGIGFRGLASGGIAVLRDYGGDDLYVGHNFAQGGGYYFGWGILVDDAGQDRYDGARYAQAWAAHQALGYLDDHAGDDRYLCWRTVGQSCSWDETVTMLLDRAGDDTYLGAGPYRQSGFALGASHNNGIALLLDLAGVDNYAWFRGPPRADGSDQVTSFSLQVDAGGDPDDYAGDPSPNGTVRHGNRNAVFADVPGDMDAAVGQVGELAATGESE